MMRFSRRAMLLSGGALAAIGATAFLTLSPQGFAVNGRRILSAAFGKHGDGPVADAFLADAERYITTELAKPLSLTLYHMDGAFGLPPRYDGEDWMAAFLTHRFAMSTNVVVAVETGEPLDYAGFFDPQDLPCANQLSATFAAQ